MRKQIIGMLFGVLSSSFLSQPVLSETNPGSGVNTAIFSAG
jgi:hypothetical protein